MANTLHAPFCAICTGFYEPSMSKRDTFYTIFGSISCQALISGQNWILYVVISCICCMLRWMDANRH